MAKGKWERVNSDRAGLELLLQLWEEWISIVPGSLRDENPRVLSKILELCDSEIGVSQAELRKHTNLSQPRISRLCARLKKRGWLTEEIPRGDGRLRMTKLTTVGRDSYKAILVGLGRTKTTFRTAAQMAQDEAELLQAIDELTAADQRYKDRHSR